MGRYVRVASVGDIAQGRSLLVEAEGKRIALWNSDAGYFALADECTHRGGPLSEGELDNHELTCPWHGASFDLRTGKVLRGPAARKVETYPVRISGEDIEIEI